MNMQTTIIQPYMQLQGEKGSGGKKKKTKKNNENSSFLTLNINTDFMLDFLIIQKYSKIRFLTLLPSKRLRQK